MNALLRKTGRSQLVRFTLVGASGYVINLTVYTATLKLIGVHYEVAALAAFLAAVGNNYALNRRWTFARSGRAMPREAARFLVVSLVGFALNASALWLFVESGVEEVPAQLLAVVVAASANFALNRSWTSRPRGAFLAYVPPCSRDARAAGRRSGAEVRLMAQRQPKALSRPTRYEEPASRLRSDVPFPALRPTSLAALGR